MLNYFTSKKNATKIDPHDLVEISGRIVLESMGASHDAGIVEGNIQPSGFLVNAREK